MLNNKDLFDLSNYDKDNQLYNNSSNNKVDNSDSDIINEAALYKKKVVWNLSGIDIPMETEE